MMRTNAAVKEFAQVLYKKYSISQISYGYNPVSETFIVRIGNEALMHDERFMEELFDFSHALAEQGEWVMFVSPSDSIMFDDYSPVVRTFGNSKAFVDTSKWLQELSVAVEEWTDTNFKAVSHSTSPKEYPAGKFEYALAA